MADAPSREFAAIINDARAAIARGREPDASALEARIRSVGERHDAADGAETALRQLERVLSVHRARSAIARHPASPAAAAAPARRTPRARPTISGNMDVRRERRGEAFVLAWEGAAGVVEWEVRISERPDVRGDYTVRDTRRLQAAETALGLPLGERPLRIHVLGRGRGGRLVRRAVISALTRENWAERWQRRASAS